MRPIRLHPRVYSDIDEALAYTRAQFGRAQVPVYARLIVEGRLTLRRHPTIGQLHENGAVYVGRFVHLARYLPDLVSADF